MNSTRRPFLQKAALSIVAANFPFSAFCQKLLNSQTKDFDPETLVIFSGVSRQTFEPLDRLTLQCEPEQQVTGLVGSYVRR